MSKKICLSIVGPTSSGKTKASLLLAETILKNKDFKKVVIINTDSKQVFKNLEIINGADIPDDFVKHKDFFKHKNLNIYLYGISIIKPNQTWSLAHSLKFARKILKQELQEDSIIFLVGGTGLYHSHVLKKEQDIFVKPDFAFRKQALNMSVNKLQNELASLNISKLESMNNSDKNNKVRLIRAIEIEKAKKQEKIQTLKDLNFLDTYKHIWFGLTVPLDILKIKILKRVKKRLNQLEDIYKQIKNLDLEKDFSLQAKMTIGLSIVYDIKNKKINKFQALNIWAKKEFDYAKRQYTFFNKNKNIIWFDGTNPQISSIMYTVLKQKM